MYMYLESSKNYKLFFYLAICYAVILSVIQRNDICWRVLSPVEDVVPSYVRLFPFLISEFHLHICRTGFMISQYILLHGTPHFGGPI